MGVLGPTHPQTKEENAVGPSTQTHFQPPLPKTLEKSRMGRVEWGGGRMLKDGSGSRGGGRVGELGRNPSYSLAGLVSVFTPSLSPHPASPRRGKWPGAEKAGEWKVWVETSRLSTSRTTLQHSPQASQIPHPQVLVQAGQPGPWRGRMDSCIQVRAASFPSLPILQRRNLRLREGPPLSQGLPARRGQAWAGVPGCGPRACHGTLNR